MAPGSSPGANAGASGFRFRGYTRFGAALIACLAFSYQLLDLRTTDRLCGLRSGLTFRFDVEDVLPRRGLA